MTKTERQHSLITMILFYKLMLDKEAKVTNVIDFGPYVNVNLEWRSEWIYDSLNCFERETFGFPKMRQ